VRPVHPGAPRGPLADVVADLREWLTVQGYSPGTIPQVVSVVLWLSAWMDDHGVGLELVRPHRYGYGICPPAALVVDRLRPPSLPAASIPLDSRPARVTRKNRRHLDPKPNSASPVPDPGQKAKIVGLPRRGDRSIGQDTRDFDLTGAAVRERGNYDCPNADHLHEAREGGPRGRRQIGEGDIAWITGSGGKATATAIQDPARLPSSGGVLPPDNGSRP
jgi:hypothetical protein